MKIIKFLFKRLICLPVAIIMFITIIFLLPAIIIVPIYWILTNRNYKENVISLFNYSCNSQKMNEIESIKSFDKFDRELFSGDVVDVQNVGEVMVYKKDDGFLYFKPYGNEEMVNSYFRNDIIKVI